jgi:photosystem II stability/assembly factor-like uncharacterized protein
MTIPRTLVAACAAVLVSGLTLSTQAHATPPGHAPGSAPAGAPIIGWRPTSTGSLDEFRGLAAVSRKVAWVSGETGTVLRTTDHGGIWQNLSFPDAAGRALRDIEAFGPRHAVVMSIGTGKRSAIWSTGDGGQSWRRVFTNHNGSAFYDCMAFSADGTGLAVSDPVNGHFRFVISHDRGWSWDLLVPRYIPRSLGEFAFAASGTCLVAGPQHQYWLASGGEHPRVYHTLNAGLTWHARPTPIRAGPTAGIYSLAFRGAARGVAVGGDFADPTNGSAAAATTSDGGVSWQLSHPGVFGYRSGVAFVNSKLVVAVGPTGSDVSRSRGARWHHFDDARYDSIACTHDGACWGSGTDGRVSFLIH